MKASKKHQNNSDDESIDEELRLARENVRRLEEASRKSKLLRVARKATEEVKALEVALGIARKAEKRALDALESSGLPVAQEDRPSVKEQLQK